MALKLENVFFNTSEDNDMSVNDCIMKTFAVDRKINYKNVVYKSKALLRELLTLEGILPKENITKIIKYAASNLVGIFFFFVVTALSFTSCIDIRNKGSENIVENEKAVEIDKTVDKHWHYYSDTSKGFEISGATKPSKNYYTSNRGENIYGIIHVNYTPAYGGLSFASVSIIATGETENNSPKTIFTIPETSHIDAIFDGNSVIFPSKTDNDNRSVDIMDGNGFIKLIKENPSCTISLPTTDGEYKFEFELTGLKI